MAHTGALPEPLAELHHRQRGVLTADAAVRWLGLAGFRWQLESGRWQRPCYGVVVTHSGRLSSDELLWVAVLGAGKGAALAGHMEPPGWWADMRRDNDLTIGGYLVLRFPSFAVRDHPDVVASQIADALRSRGQTW